MRSQTVIVDINKQTCKNVKYKQYDNNNLLRVIVMEDDYKEVDLTDYKGYVFFELPSGLILEKSCVIQKNIIEVNIDNSILIECGKAICEITLSNKEKVSTLFKINIIIEESIDREEAIESVASMDLISEFTKINETIIKIDDTLEELESLDNIEIIGQITQENIDKWNSAKGMTDEEKEQLETNTENILKIMEAVDEPPTYKKPVVNLSTSKTTVEHNVSTSVVLTPSFSQNDAGSLQKYTLKKDNQTLYEGSLQAYTDTIILTHNNTITYTATVSYGDGTIKNTTLGIQYPSTSIKAGSISTTKQVKAYAPTYYGVINTNNISGVNGLTSIIGTSKSNTLTFTLTNQYIVYMYPKSFGNLTSIKDANNFDYINSYTLTTTTYNGVEYNVYILTDAVTINGFKQIYN